MKRKNCAFCTRLVQRITLLVAVVPALLLIPGCATLSKADCLNGDWYEFGLEDGKAGLESDRFNEYVDICAKYGVSPDFAKYSEGRTKGLEFFCTRNVGYAEGREGRKYQDVCSGAAEEFFLEGHTLGYRVYAAVELVDSIDKELSPLIKQFERLSRRDSIRRDGDRDLLVDSGGVEQDIIALKEQIKPLQERRVDAIIEFREAVDEANDNGFREDVDVGNDMDVRDEHGILDGVP